MLVFYPLCDINNLNGQHYFVCNSCVLNSQQKKNITHRVYLKLRSVDDVLGGVEAWKNVNSIDCSCSECGHSKFYFLHLHDNFLPLL